MKIHKVSSVQSGLSHAELCLYHALWNRHKKEQDDGTKLVIIGWQTMATISGMTDNNARCNCRRLIDKMVLDKISEPSACSGTTYRIYPYEQILIRWRKAGMEYVVKNRGGVTFSLADSESKGTPLKGTVPTEGTPRIPTEGTPGIPTEGIHIDKAKKGTSGLQRRADLIGAEPVETSSDAASHHSAWAAPKASAHLTGPISSSDCLPEEEQVEHVAGMGEPQVREIAPAEALGVGAFASPLNNTDVESWIVPGTSITITPYHASLAELAELYAVMEYVGQHVPAFRVTDVEAISRYLAESLQVASAGASGAADSVRVDETSQAAGKADAKKDVGDTRQQVEDAQATMDTLDNELPLGDRIITYLAGRKDYCGDYEPMLSADIAQAIDEDSYAIGYALNDLVASGKVERITRRGVFHYAALVEAAQAAVEVECDVGLRTVLGRYPVRRYLRI